MYKHFKNNSMKEIFDFNSNIKKNLLYLFIGGLTLSLIGLYQVINSGHGHEEVSEVVGGAYNSGGCLLYTSPSPRDKRQSRMPSSA